MSLRTIENRVDDIIEATGLRYELDALGESTPSSKAHSLSVGSLVMHAAYDRLSLSGGHVTALTVAAISHDIGKSSGGIPGLVELDRKLSAEEHAVVAKHTVIGDRRIMELSKRQVDVRSKVVLALAAIVARDHHNPLDTRTYQGEFTGLITLADRFDATHGARRGYISEAEHAEYCSQDPADLLRRSDNNLSGNSPVLFGVAAAVILRELPSYQHEPALNIAV